MNKNFNYHSVEDALPSQNNSQQEGNTNSLKEQSESISKEMDESGLSDFLKVIEPIDFKSIYYQEDNYFLEKIAKYQDKLSKELTDEERDTIIKELINLEPKTEAKSDMFVMVLMSLFEQYSFHLAFFEDETFRVYNPNLKYWKKVNQSTVQHFLYKAAQHAGIKAKFLYNKKEKERLMYHFKDRSIAMMPQKASNMVSINLQNGVYEISENFVGLREHRASDYHFYILPYAYDENATCPLFDKFLKTRLPEVNACLALAEMCALALCPQLNLQIAAVLQGPGRTGKSTFNIIITFTFGTENVASFTLTSLCSTSASSDYIRAKLPDYLLNYSSEMGGKGCDTNMVKKLISREHLEARHPYGRPFLIKDYCPTMFNVNDLPPMENTSAYWSRFMFFPFHVVVRPEENDVDFAKKIVENELPGVFNWILAGLKRVMKNKKITQSKICDNLKNSLQREYDPVAMFIYEDDLIGRLQNGNYEYTSTLFERFKEYSKENNLKSQFMTRTTFIKRLGTYNELFIDKNAPNHRYRVYLKNQNNKNE